jgi:hypothetical protein
VLVLPIWAAACGGGGGQSKPDAHPQDGSVPVTTQDGGWVPEAGSTDALPPGDPQLPVIPGAAGDLATRLTAAADDDSAVAVTQEILAKLGVDIVNVEGEPAFTPAAPSLYKGASMVPVQVFNLAVQGRARATESVMTLEQLGVMLADFGFEHDPDAPVGDALVAGVAAAVNASLGAPDDPASFPALFVAAMAQKQSPPVNLADASTRGDQVRLGLLDAEVLITGLTRKLRADTAPGDAGAPTDDGGTADADSMLAAVTDCSSFKESLGLFGVPAGMAVDKVSDKTQELLIKTALEKAGVTTAEATTEFISKALGKLKLALNVLRLAGFYMNASIDLSSDAPMIPVHRPAPEDPDRYLHYTARVHVDTDAYAKAFSASDVQRDLALDDCLRQLGLPVPPTSAQLAADADKWRVAWDIPTGGGVHGEWDSTAHWTSKTFENVVTRSTPTEVVDKDVPVHLVDELGPGHRGDLISDGKLTVTASINASQAPSIETFLSAAASLPLAIADLAMGWFQTVVQPKASLTLPISYHLPYKGWRGYIRGTVTYPPGTLKEEDRDTCGSFHRDELYNWTKKIEYVIEGSEASGAGNLPGFMPLARGDILHGQGSVLCAALWQTVDKTVNCGDHLVDSTQVVTIGSNSYPLVDAARAGVTIPTGAVGFSLLVAFNQPIGGPPPTEPAAYQLLPVGDQPCMANGSILQGRRLTTKTSRLLQTPTTTEESALIDLKFPDKITLTGTWDPKDPDHLHGTAGPVKSIANPLPTTVMQSATWEWDLRRVQ